MKWKAMVAFNKDIFTTIRPMKKYKGKAGQVCCMRVFKPHTSRWLAIGRPKKLAI